MKDLKPCVLMALVQDVVEWLAASGGGYRFCVKRLNLNIMYLCVVRLGVDVESRIHDANVEPITLLYSSKRLIFYERCVQKWCGRPDWGLLDKWGVKAQTYKPRPERPPPAGSFLALFLPFITVLPS